MIFLSFVFHLFILSLSLIALGKSADFLITAVTRLGFIFRLSQFLTGFILLGIATSTPEMSVAINSSLAGNPQLSLGNLLGANVVLLTFISGLTAILAKGVDVKKDLSQPSRLIQIALLITAPLFLLIDSRLSRSDGIFLLLLYVMYIIYIYRARPNQSPPLSHQLMNYKIINTLLLVFTGLFGLILSSKAVVYSSLQLASLLNIPVLFLGLLVLSLGTNLPEISIAMAATRKHHPSLVLGDVLGSAATNTLVIAIVAVISPFNITSLIAYQTTAIFLLLSLACFYFMTRSKLRLSPTEGIILLILYVAFVTSEILTAYLKP